MKLFLKNYRSSSRLSVFFFRFWWLFDWFDCLFHLDSNGAAAEEAKNRLVTAFDQYDIPHSGIWRKIQDRRSVGVLLGSNSTSKHSSCKNLFVFFLSDICTLLNILHHLPASISSRHLTYRDAAFSVVFWLHLLYPTLITPCGHTSGDTASCSKRGGDKEPAAHLPARLYLILDLAGLCCLVSVDMNLE